MTWPIPVVVMRMQRDGSKEINDLSDVLLSYPNEFSWIKIMDSLQDTYIYILVAISVQGSIMRIEYPNADTVNEGKEIG